MFRCRCSLRFVLLGLLSALVDCGTGSDLYCGENNCYELLGVKRDTPTEDIKKAYRKLALKLHPDRNKAKDAAEVFAKIGRAWEVLGKEEVRAAYDYFLENPEAGFRNYYNYYEAVYHPPVPIWAIVVGMLLFGSLLQYVNDSRNYASTMRYVKVQDKFKRRVNEVLAERENALKKRMQKGAKAALREQIENEIIATEVKLTGSGSQRPSWKNIFAVQAVLMPLTVSRFLAVELRRLWLYTVMKRDYDEAEQVYRTRSALAIPDDSWEELGQETQTTLLGRGLWDREKLATFLGEEAEAEAKGKKGLLTVYKRQAARQNRMMTEDDYYE